MLLRINNVEPPPNIGAEEVMEESSQVSLSLSLSLIHFTAFSYLCYLRVFEYNLEIAFADVGDQSCSQCRFWKKGSYVSLLHEWEGFSVEGT